jgi:hypothetical protein
MSNIRTTPGGSMEAKDANGVWQSVPAGAQKEIERLRSGLTTLSTTFYKDDQHQEYAKHVLAGRKSN